MTVLKVLTVPNPRLRVKAQPVEYVDNVIRKLMDDMMETMYADDGVGLAATQVGVAKRVVVCDLSDSDPALGPLKMANPEIIWQSPDRKRQVEACLSVPDQSAEVERAVSVKVRYLDENNISNEIEVSGIVAICMQHEIDHLDGKLYIDYLSPLKKQLLIQKAQKAERARPL